MVLQEYLIIFRILLTMSTTKLEITVIKIKKNKIQLQLFGVKTSKVFKEI